MDDEGNWLIDLMRWAPPLATVPRHWHTQPAMWPLELTPTAAPCRLLSVLERTPTGFVERFVLQRSSNAPHPDDPAPLRWLECVPGHVVPERVAWDTVWTTLVMGNSSEDLSKKGREVHGSVRP